MPFFPPGSDPDALTGLTGDVVATGPGDADAELSNTGVTAASYTNASITVDVDGRITAASSGAAGGITTLTGDVTAGPGSGFVAATLAAGSASVLNSGTLNASRLPALTGDVTTSAGSAATTLAAGSATALNSGTLDAARLPAMTGDVTASAGTNATTLAAGSATNLNSGTLNAARLPAFTGDVTTAGGSAATTIATAAVTLAKQANLANATRIGRNTAGTGVPEAVTNAQEVALLQNENNGMGAAYYTASLDFLTLSSGNAMIPAKVGYYFLAAAARCFVLTRTGTTTGTLTFTIGNDASELNLLPASSVAGATLTTGTPPINVGGLGTNQSGTTASAATPYTLKITSAATGSSVLTGRIAIIGVWVPV